MKHKLTRMITRLVAEQIRGVISIYQFDEYFYVEIIDNKNYVWRTTLEEIRINLPLIKKAKVISSAIVIAYRKHIENTYFY